jgi:mono/diheme cytochrome c family protein
VKRVAFSFYLASTVFCALAVAGTAPEELEFFEKQVRPVLSEHCLKCHGPEKQKADLRLDSRAALLKGADTGPVVVPGKPDESSLIRSIQHAGDSKMPEKAEKLPPSQISALVEWVRMGVPWPAGDAPAPSSFEWAAKNHWAFQAVQSPAVPNVPRFRVANPIDAFVAEKLEKHRIAQAPPASRRTLLRRATYWLTGLPPSAEEYEAFERDPQPDAAAFAGVVDRLLASLRYGERWGRHWLDVARYADTKGYVFQEERQYAFSFTYRDWVIAALNADMPYDQFLVRQIAADQLGVSEPGQSMAALGFLTLGRRFINNAHDIIDDRIDLICRGTMGLTVACARCHDHKFDPVTQKDYYALYGVFASSREPELQDLPLLSQTPPHENYVKERDAADARIQQLYGRRALELGLLVGHLQGAPIWLGASSVEPFFQSAFFTRKAHDELRALQNQRVRVELNPHAPARAMALVDKPQPVNPRVFLRGNPGRPGDVVPRRFLTVLSGGDPRPFEKGSGRLELAQAIASPHNPLTARVYVNRVWAQHFGAGLVRTPGDFGVKGEPPTHPELLDWLASRFMEEGWSIKKLHRLILLSATYQQTSDPDPVSAEADPENRWLGRFQRRRLDFEAFRDSLLFAAGQLDLAMGGRSVELTGESPALRRTVYGFIDRQNLPGVFRTFDFANPDATSPQRHVTTVPQQALFMLNSPFVMDRARGLAGLPGLDALSFSEPQVQPLYRRVFARNAAPAEVEMGLRFLREQQAQGNPPPESPLWQYGFGHYDDALQRVVFEPLPHWTGTAWQGSARLPDPKVGWVTLNKSGGHPGQGPGHAAIRRWTAPADAVLQISGVLRKVSPDGDGVLGRIVSSRSGELAQARVEPGKSAELGVANLSVQRGESVDFIVESHGSAVADTFLWEPQIRSEAGEWAAGAGFGGPAPSRKPLSPWEKYAQVLLFSNEFAFVD